MSYIVLARKYRPRNFSEMVGQAHVVQALGNALTQQRLHHAYLFTGTRGVGKTTVSRILAKSLNCTGVDGQGGITATPCGQCPACTEIDSGRFPDYIELDAASNRGVDEVQSLLEQAVYKPVQGRFKVFMIDEVHMLTNTAFNAMLKTLEEPPEYLKFVLATTDPQKVPVTVLSRCLQFNLRPMAPETVLEHLKTVLQQENVSFEEQALRLLAQGARGSMRDALSLTDQAIAFGSGQLQEQAVRQMLGAVSRSHVFALVTALAQGNGRVLVETVDELRQHGISATGALQELCAVLQRMAVLQAVPDMATAQDSADPDAAQLQALASQMPAEETQLCYSIALHGQQELGLAPDEYAALTMVLLRPLAFKAPAALAEKKILPPIEAAPAMAAPVAIAVVPAPTPIPEPAPTAIAAPPESVAPLAPPPPPTAPAAPTQAPSANPNASFSHTATADEEPPPWLDIPPEAQFEPAVLEAAVAVQPPKEVAPVPKPPEPELPATSPSAAPASPESEPPPSPGDNGLADFWFACVQQLLQAEAITALARELALQSQLVQRSDSAWHIQVQRSSLQQEQTVQRLAQALAAHCQCPALQVQPGAVQDTPAQRLQAQAEQRQRQAEQLVANDPQVQALVAQFGASIVPGSVRAL
ncbi:MAG: DNA polymerase III subunit gamma/tau [Comamonas sp.]|nr:DNA polymerase III subunit gamma/tau [Comamonas sp.]